MATKEEMLFAMQAMKHNLLDRPQVEEALAFQRSMDEQGKPVELMKILVKSGALSRQDFERMRDALRAHGDDMPFFDEIPGFKIVARIGAGGMANVYRAVREADGLVVALKVLFPSQANNPRFVDQFLREAELIAHMEHRHICRGHDYGFTGERYYMALEFISGPTVLSLLEARGRLPASFACYVTTKVADALDYMARMGFVHRDIKPDNVLVTSKGLVKIIDLGFAKRYRGEDADGETSEITCGTVEYISPEQARGDADLDPRADIYSLGATLYHMVVGEVPFSGEDAHEVMAKQVQEGLSEMVKQHGVPKHIHYFIEKMMAKDRELRFQSPGELVAELNSVLESMADIDPGSVVPPSAGTDHFALEKIQQASVGTELPPAPAPRTRVRGAARRRSTHRRSKRR